MAQLLAIISDDIFVMLIGMFVICGAFEFLMPAKSIPGKHYFLNTVFGISHTVLIILISPALAFLVAIAVRKLGVGLIDLRSLNLGEVGGQIFALLLATLIADFFLYWYHRSRHSSNVLWQTHLVHHSDEYLNVTSYPRGHFTEVILQPLFVTIPIAFLFKLPPVTIAMLSLVPTAWEYFSHANLKIGFGPLWWLLVSPDFHRIHHSIEKKHFDKNFATWFPLWDILFKTAWRPRKGERPATGVKGINIHSVWELYALPFREWAKLFRERKHVKSS